MKVATENNSIQKPQLGAAMKTCHGCWLFSVATAASSWGFCFADTEVTLVDSLGSDASFDPRRRISSVGGFFVSRPERRNALLLSGANVARCKRLRAPARLEQDTDESLRPREVGTLGWTTDARVSVQASKNILRVTPGGDAYLSSDRNRFSLSLPHSDSRAPVNQMDTYREAARKTAKEGTVANQTCQHGQNGLLQCPWCEIERLKAIVAAYEQATHAMADAAREDGDT